jgi:glycosyltransferase involved in cell wall biosynthesis
LAAGYTWYFDQLNVQTLLFKNGFDRVTVWRTGSSAAATDELVPSIPGGATLAVLAHKCAIKPIWTVSVIVPVFNEIRTFPRLFEQLYALNLATVEKEIIVVESGSTDGTQDAVRAIQDVPGVRVIWQDRPRGKGYAVRAGLNEATGDFVIIQDADLEYDLNDYAILLEPLMKGSEAFVIGSRHGTTGWKIRSFSDSVPLASALNLGHLFFTSVVNIAFNQHLADPFSMFKVFRRDCLYGLSFECDRFDFDFELLVKLVRKGYRPSEIPVNYTSRSFAEGKKVSIARDPLTWLWAIAKYRRQPTSAYLKKPLVTLADAAVA